jgi:hypothetical protein
VIAENTVPADEPVMPIPCGCQPMGANGGPPLADYFEAVTPSAVETWIPAAIQFAPASQWGVMVARFVRLKPSFQENEQDDKDMERWSNLDASVQHDPLDPPHLRRLAKILGDLACTADGAPYLARAFVDPRYYAVASSTYESRLSTLGDQLNSVRDRIKDSRKNPEACPGVTGFTESDWSALDAIKPAEAASADH